VVHFLCSLIEWVEDRMGSVLIWATGLAGAYGNYQQPPAKKGMASDAFVVANNRDANTSSHSRESMTMCCLQVPTRDGKLAVIGGHSEVRRVEQKAECAYLVYPAPSNACISFLLLILLGSRQFCPVYLCSFCFASLWLTVLPLLVGAQP
jgi:hypothetical protein